MAKNRKKKEKDFQKVKLKVGKRLKKADNVTNTSFKSRSIQINQQLKTSDTTQPTTKKRQNIADLLTQMKHFSPSVRHEAVVGMKEILTTNTDLIQTHLPGILEKSFQLVSDKDSAVRRAVVKSILKVVFPQISEKQIMPFFPLFCAHLCCAMTHINDGIKVDSLNVLDLLLEYYPRLVVGKSNQVLLNFIEQISRQKGDGEARSLTTNPDSETSGVQWRVKVLNRLQKCLEAVILCFGDDRATGQKSDSINDNQYNFKENDYNMIQVTPAYVKSLWESPGFTCGGGLSNSSSQGQSTFLDCKFQQFASTLIPLMMECWIEAKPSRKKKGESRKGGQAQRKGRVDDGMNPSMMYSVVKVTQLLWQCSTHINNQQSGEQVSLGKYEKEVETQFMAGFPYNIEVATKQPDKKQRSAVPLEQVSSETLNLTICDVIAGFIKRTGAIPWLSHVINYVTKVLNNGGLVAAANVGLIVHIAEVLRKSGVLTSDVCLPLLTEMLARYGKTRPGSMEQKTYLRFLSTVILEDHITHKVRPGTVKGFVDSLPELLPLCVKSDPQMASHIIDVILSMCCHGSSTNGNHRTTLQCMMQNVLNPETGCVLELPAPDQRKLLSLLYHVPDVDDDLMKTVVSLCRSDQLSESSLLYTVQVLQNRYIKDGEQPQNASLHVSLLGNLLLGYSSEDIRSMKKNRSIHTWLSDSDGIINTMTTDGTARLNRHYLAVEAVGYSLRQCFNTLQMAEVLITFIHKAKEQLKILPLEAVYSVCRIADLIGCPDHMASFIQNLALSLVGMMVVCQEPANQETVERMMDCGCNLLSEMENGLTFLLATVNGLFEKDVTQTEVKTGVKMVMLFFHDKYKTQIRRAENVNLLKKLHTSVVAYRSMQDSLTEETGVLLAKFCYTVSNLC